MTEFSKLTASTIAEKIRSGELSALELAKESIAMAKTIGKELNAFVTICEEKALRQAEAVQDKVSSGEGDTLPLCGVPIAIKDNICYSDYKTSCGSHILDNFVSPYDATVVDRLVRAGAIIIGKTNMDEFAMGSSSENSFYGSVKNPISEGFVPGGSSGGSAAAVAAGIVPIALGSETGGSIRQPAAFTGLLGLKPTYGSVSRYGLVAYGSSLDQIGLFGRSTKDISCAFKVINGYDEKDSTSILPVDQENNSQIYLNPTMSVGMPSEYLSEQLHPEIRAALDKTAEKLESLGYKIKEVSLPLTDKAVAAYYITACAEASSNLSRFDGVRYGLREGGKADLDKMYSSTRTAGFSWEVKRRIMLGTFALSSGYYDEYYGKASQVRQLIREEYLSAFEKVDLIIGPTTPTLAFPEGEILNDPLTMYLADIYTVPANLTGIPALSIPSGKSRDERTIGIQFMSPHHCEQKLFDVADLLKAE